MEIEGEQEKVDVKSLPEEYRRCVADELVNLSPPAVAASVEAFAKSDLYKDYYVLVDKIKPSTPGLSASEAQSYFRLPSRTAKVRE